MNATTTASTTTMSDTMTRRGVASRKVFNWVAVLLLPCIAIQVMLAGAAVMTGDVAYWGYHKTFIHFFEAVPLILLVIAFIGRSPASIKWMSLGVLGLIQLQYIFLEFRPGYSLGAVPIVAALHPTNALVIFWVSVELVRRTRAPDVAAARPDWSWGRAKATKAKAAP